MDGKHFLVFQSTLPVGEATEIIWVIKNYAGISIHASRGGSDGDNSPNVSGSGNFNPRFPWGKRLLYPPSASVRVKFQSTLPVGEATLAVGAAGRPVHISIHASRGGSDIQKNPEGGTCNVFQSTLPVGEATNLGRRLRPMQ